MLIFMSTPAFAAHPLLRVKAGVSDITISGSPTVEGQKLGSMLTLQPSVLWELTSYSSRLGVHYLQELGGPLGFTTVSGMGISGYFHFFGISTSYSKTQQGDVIQRSTPGPYLYGSVTPVNFNVNRFEKNSASNFFASYFLYDISAGLGYDHPLTRNMILSAEFILRNGTTGGTSDTGAKYQGYTLFFSFATSYH